MPTVNELKRQVEAGLWDAAFVRLYGGAEEVLRRQRARYAEALEAFGALYGAGREAAVYSAPGRTEISGNHTDHNHGVVMAAAVDLDVIAVVSQNTEGIIRVKSKGFEGRDIVPLDKLEPVPSEKGRSSAMVRGVAAGMARRGGLIGGFDAYTTSDVLGGSGLSSSAAFEVLLGTILNGEYNDGRFSAVELAQIGQLAENEFFGKPCGLLDQMTSSVGGVVAIDFKNPAVPVVDSLVFDLSQYGYHLCISDTKGSHADLTDEYAAVRSEMESVAACFGKAVLREVEECAFYAQLPAVREKTGDRAVLRAIHFFEECRRVEALRDAVRGGRFEDFLSLVIESGNSSFEYNQNAYSARAPRQQGVPLGLALSQRILNGRGAWRLQGGGFAGTIQAFVPDALLAAYKAEIEHVFGRGSCYVLNVRSCGGVRVNGEL